MSDKSKGNSGLLLIAGAIAGAAATYYLNTPEGKKLTNKVFNKGMEVKDQIASSAKQVAEVTSDKIDQGKTKLTETTIGMLDKAETKLGNFQSGVNAAKDKLKNGVMVEV